MKNFVLAAKCLIVFLAVLIVVFCSIYRYEISPISKDSTKKEIVVTEGSTWYSLSTVLFENKLIKSEKFYKIYIKLFKPGKLEVGKYELSSDMSLDKIIAKIEEGSNYNPDDVTITFREGLNMRFIADLIAKNTDNTTDDVFDKLEDSKYISGLIDKYWFLDEEIEDERIFYPLEGYLFPDTYSVSKNSSVEEIFGLMLDKTNEVLSKYKEDIKNSDLSVHEILTLASIVELEANKPSERAKVAGVFFNRINTGMSLGSDVTAYYSHKIDNWDGLTMDQLSGCNAYNTRGSCVIGLPVGPICNPGVESIKAVLNPVESDYYYFVADCEGNTYLSKDDLEHSKIVNQLIDEGKWCDQ